MKDERPNLVYAIINPHTKKSVNHPTHAWKYSQSTYETHVQENRLWWGIDGKLRYPRLKNFLSESEAKGIVPIDLMLADTAGTTNDGTKLLQSVFQSTALEFNNPKPIDLIANLIGIAEGVSKNNDTIILDSFAGSGTTAHAVLALNKSDGGNRKFILVECEDYADNITAERVRRVINGVENVKDENLRDGLGGSFTYCTLGDTIDTEGMLTGDTLPTYETLARYIAWTATGSKLEVKAQQEDYCFGETKDIRFYLIYKPTLAFLESNKSALDASLADQIAEQCKGVGKKAYVYASHKFMSQKDLTPLGITFCQLPYSIY